MEDMNIDNINPGDVIYLHKISNNIISELYKYAIQINCKLIRIDHYHYYFKSELYFLRNERINLILSN